MYIFYLLHITLGAGQLLHHSSLKPFCSLLLEVVTSREKQQHIVKQLRESIDQHSRRRPFSSSALGSEKNGVHRRCIRDVVTAAQFDRVELSWDSVEERMHRLNITPIMSPGLSIANLPPWQYQITIFQTLTALSIQQQECNYEHSVFRFTDTATIRPPVAVVATVAISSCSRSRQEPSVISQA